jgi:hypothetical protein
MIMIGVGEREEVGKTEQREDKNSKETESYKRAKWYSRKLN